MPTMSQQRLQKALDARILHRMADARSFERGEEYFAAGRVGSLADYEGTLTAKVRGTHTYSVKLWTDAGQLEYSCTCPVGDDGAFCKHCVAVGLAWLAKGTEKTFRRKRTAPVVTMDDVRAYLAGLDQDVLADMLVEQAMDDDRLRRRLFLKAAKKGPKGFDLATYRQAIDSAVDHDGSVDYWSARDYARGIEEAIDSIAELLKEGYAAQVIELAEYALEAVENALGSVDDSDGYMGGILERLQELHLQACKMAKPDPEALARRLFAWELRTHWDTFYGAAATYADVFGKSGLTIYRKLAEAEWAKVPKSGPGNYSPVEHSRHFRITHIMETLARQTGDVEALVAIKKRDLSLPYAYLQIAEVYKKARKHNLALEWAERGLKAFPERTDSRLREFLAEEYHRRKAHDKAMALIWAEFAESTHLSQYQNLKAHADRIAQWPAWREKALGFLREEIARSKRAARSQQSPWSYTPDGSELVR
ncbi:MAG: hypothetical protein A3F68_09800, partial [Acidobacteria bacterium RIFCSPLOWO2_12_FULL_54_10]